MHVGTFQPRSHRAASGHSSSRCPDFNYRLAEYLLVGESPVLRYSADPTVLESTHYRNERSGETSWRTGRRRNHSDSGTRPRRPVRDDRLLAADGDAADSRDG